MSDTTFNSAASVSGVHVADWGGAAPVVSGNLSYFKFGRIIILQFPTVSGTAVASIPIVTADTLPDFLRPLNSQLFLFNVISNNVNVVGSINILAGDGSMNIFADLNAGNFTMGQVVGFNTQTVTYLSQI